MQISKRLRQTKYIYFHCSIFAVNVRSSIDSGPGDGWPSGDHSGPGSDGCPDRGADDGLCSGQSRVFSNYSESSGPSLWPGSIHSGGRASSVCQSDPYLVDSVQLRNAVSARGEPQGLLAVWPWFRVSVDLWLGLALKTFNFISYPLTLRSPCPPQHSRDKSILVKPDQWSENYISVPMFYLPRAASW